MFLIRCYRALQILR